MPPRFAPRSSPAPGRALMRLAALKNPPPTWLPRRRPPVRVVPRAARRAHSWGAAPVRSVMNATNVLQQWSQERSQLAAELAPRTVAIPIGPHRSVSGIRWRGSYIVTAAEALSGSDEVTLL